MSVPGFSHSMNELSNQLKHERQRLERERLQSEYGRYWPGNDDPISTENTICELRRIAKREERTVQIWAWSFAVVVVGSLFGLMIWLLPAPVVIGIAIMGLISGAVGLGIVWHDRRRYPSGGHL